ncbi:hypothetical protein ACOMHN_028601 [Nucella lapillus]
MSGIVVSANHSQTDSPVVSAVDGVTELGDAGRAVGRPWDTSDPFFTAETRNLIRIIFSCGIHPVVLYPGILANLTCCVVFWKQGLSDRINLLLFWLAVADCLHLASRIQTSITCYSSDNILIQQVVIIADAKINIIYAACGFISGNLIVVMSVERCLHVVIPFKARRLLTYRSMVTAIVLSYLIPGLTYLPLILSQTVKWRVDPSTNRSIAYTEPSSWFPPGRFHIMIPNSVSLIDNHRCLEQGTISTEQTPIGNTSQTASLQQQDQPGDSRQAPATGRTRQPTWSQRAAPASISKREGVEKMSTQHLTNFKSKAQHLKHFRGKAQHLKHFRSKVQHLKHFKSKPQHLKHFRSEAQHLQHFRSKANT